jgi:hypothetical protein
MGLYLECQKIIMSENTLESSLPPTSHECPSYEYWFEARLKVLHLSHVTMWNQRDFKHCNQVHNLRPQALPFMISHREPRS